MWSLLEICIYIIAITLIITQWIIPPFINKPFFWLFRKDRLNDEYNKIRELEEEIRLEELKEKRKNLIRKI